MDWYDMIWYDMIWYDLIWYDLIWSDMIWYDMVWYDMIWFDMIWYVLPNRFASEFWTNSQLLRLEPLQKLLGSGSEGQAQHLARRRRSILYYILHPKTIYIKLGRDKQVGKLEDKDFYWFVAQVLRLNTDIDTFFFCIRKPLSSPCRIASQPLRPAHSTILSSKSASLASDMNCTWQLPGISKS